MVTVECISSKAPTLIRVYYNLKVYELFDIFTCHSTEKLLHRKCGPPTLSLSLSLALDHYRSLSVGASSSMSVAVAVAVAAAATTVAIG